MKIKKIYIGGWFQRTTLHLSEIWDFLKYKKSLLGFAQKDLNNAQAKLNLEKLSRKSGPIEYISAHSTDRIDYRIYEDGLMIFEKEDFGKSLKNDFKTIQTYYDQKFSKAISLIFSKGAPVPKELADIKSIFPYILIIENGSAKEISDIFSLFGEEMQGELSVKGVSVYRSEQIIVINGIDDEETARSIAESQIFFREFKAQLHRYLAIHRIIWEKIDDIKDKGEIKGSRINFFMNELWGYQKTINLIDARINQMEVYLKTRQEVSNLDKIDSEIISLFQFKFETLANTHEYIKYLWAMTRNYLDSALNIFIELQNKTTKEALSSLQLVTIINVLGILANTYLLKQKFPPLWTYNGLLYIAGFLVLAIGINIVIAFVYRSKKYSLKKMGDIVKNIK